MITKTDTFRSYVDVIEEIYNNWEKVIGEGTEITLIPTRKGKMSLLPKGNTFQKTTTGKNMFDDSQNSGLWVSQGGSITTTQSSNVRRYTAVPNQDITISAKFSNPSSNTIIVIAFYDINDNLLGRYVRVNQGVMTLTQTTPANASYYYAGRYVTKPDEIMLEKSSSATPYEPYTGGIASPNPSYPSDIEVVKGDNEVVVQNRNLITDNVEDLEQGSINGPDGNPYSANNRVRTKMIPFEYDYIIQQGYLLTIPTGYEIALRFYDADKKYIFAGISKTGWVTSLLVNSFANKGIKYARFVYRKTDDSNITPQDIANVGFQLNIGTTALSYVPHKEQVLPINLGDIELAKIGTYQDYIYKENDKWYKYGVIKKMVLNGTENWSIFTNVVDSTLYRLQDVNDYIKGNLVYSNYYKGISSQIDRQNFNIYLRTDNAIALDILDNRFTTLADFKAQLSTNNVTVYYVLATPTITEITDTTLIEQLEDLEAAFSYDNQTNITQTNDNLPFIISAAALMKGGN